MGWLKCIKNGEEVREEIQLQHNPFKTHIRSHIKSSRNLLGVLLSTNIYALYVPILHGTIIKVVKCD